MKLPPKINCEYISHPVLNTDFYSKEKSQMLNGLFLTILICGMLEGKYHRNLVLVLSFVAGFIENITTFQDNDYCGSEPLKDVTTIYSYIMISLI